MSEKVNKSKKRHLSTIIRILVAVGAVSLVFRGEDMSSLGRTFAGINLFVFAGGLALFVVAQLVFVIRWYLLLKTQEINIGYWVAVKLHFIGLFYNNCLPGAIGGDLLRAWYATKHTDKKFEAALSVFIDRAIGLVCTIAMAGFYYWLIVTGDDSVGLEITGKGGAFPFWAYAKWGGVALGAAGLGVLVMCLFGRGRQLISKMYGIAKHKGLELIKRIFAAVCIYCRRPGALLVVVFFTFLSQYIAITSIWLICQQLGVEADIKYYFAFFPISWVLGAIPISIGGAGVIELGLKGLFGCVESVSVYMRNVPGLVQRAIWLITSLGGVFIHLKGGHLPASKEEIFVDSSDTIA